MHKLIAVMSVSLITISTNATAAPAENTSTVDQISEEINQLISQGITVEDFEKVVQEKRRNTLVTSAKSNDAKKIQEYLDNLGAEVLLDPREKIAGTYTRPKKIVLRACVKSAWGPGVADYKLDNPGYGGFGFSNKSESSNSMYWARKGKQDVDGIYNRRLFGGENAYKVTDNARVIVYEELRWGECVNAATREFYSPSWVNTTQGDEESWPEAL